MVLENVPVYKVESVFSIGFDTEITAYRSKASVLPQMLSAELLVGKEDFKFSCAHFIAHADTREKLHGHNYRATARVLGALDTAGDGYIVDFSVVKKAMRGVCAELDERFLLPTCNPHLSITWEKDGLRLASGDCESAVIAQATSVLIVANCDGARFQMPTTDVVALSVPNITVEALAGVLARRFVRHAAILPHVGAGVTRLSVGVTETAGQEAILTFDAAALLREEQATLATATPLGSRHASAGGAGSGGKSSGET